MNLIKKDNKNRVGIQVLFFVIMVCIFLLMYFLFIILYKPLLAEPICLDSDNGLNYSVVGVTNGSLVTGGNISSYRDVCGTTDQLIEYYCSADLVKIAFYLCPYGCENGACKDEPKCWDTDNSMSSNDGPFTAGNTTGIFLQGWGTLYNGTGHIIGNASDRSKYYYSYDPNLNYSVFYDYCDTNNSNKEWEGKCSKLYNGTQLIAEFIWVVYNDCPLGCENGACRKPNISCVDYDKSSYSNYITQYYNASYATGPDQLWRTGYIILPNGTRIYNSSLPYSLFYDYCVPGTNQLNEARCGNDKLEYYGFQCSNGCENSSCKCIDSDEDGFNITIGCGLIDCDDSNASISPKETEICGNGIDEDCSGADLSCSTCGNGIIDYNEQCDTTNITGTCESFGYNSGTLLCIDCDYEFSQCSNEENCTDTDKDNLNDYNETLCVNGTDFCPYTNDTWFKGNLTRILNYMPFIEGFNHSINLTNFNESELLNKSLEIENSKGKIIFLDKTKLIRINETGCFERLNFSQENFVKIEDRKVFVNGSYGKEFNKAATLIFYGVTFIQPKILRNSVDCSDCQINSYSNGVLSVNVSGFSTYEAVEGYSTPPSGGGGGSGGGGYGGSGGDNNKPLNKINESIQLTNTNKTNISEKIQETNNLSNISNIENFSDSKERGLDRGKKDRKISLTFIIIIGVIIMIIIWIVKYRVYGKLFKHKNHRL